MRNIRRIPIGRSPTNYFVSLFTVDSHRKNLIAKLNVKNTASLVRLAVERNLI